MDNPHIVKESVPYTIKQFVTGRPLTDDEREMPDSHGVYPVSPLGFLYEDVEGEVKPLPTTEFGSASGYTDVAKVITNLCATTMIALRSTPTITVGRSVKFPVVSLSRTANGFTAVVEGDVRPQSATIGTVTISSQISCTGYFSNAVEGNDYSALGIIGTRNSSGVLSNSFTVSAAYDATTGRSTVTIPAIAAWKLTGTVPAGRILLNVSATAWESAQNLGNPRNIYCVDTGVVYQLGRTEEEEYSARWKYSTASAQEGGQIYSMDDLVSTASDCNGGSHIRNGYSDREVMEWVDGKVGGIISSGTHPYSRVGNISDAGALVKWFVSGGTVDIGSGMGSSVLVDGFGLGAGYFDEGDNGAEASSDKPRFDDGGNKIDYSAESVAPETTMRISSDTYVDHPEVGHPVLTYGYGTSNVDVASDGSKALPRDWPFTTESSAANTNNNITFPGKAVTFNGTSVGGMYGGKTCDVCYTCRGLGYINGSPCTACNGTGDINEVTVDLNRAHVCIYNDFTRKTSADASLGYTADTTVLKKTFLHLAAPLDTKDGAEYEITVSLPNINVGNAFSGADKVKNLSAYYSYVSQPRVYVLGGTWKFSDTRVEVTDPSAGTVSSISGGSGFYDRDDSLLPTGIKVRFNLESNRMTPSSTEMMGKLTANAEGGCTISLDTAFPYDVGGRGWASDDMYICGLAYLPNSETNNPTGTSMGLISRTDEVVKGADYGNGGSNSLNRYNKMFSLDTRTGRTRLSGNTDNRYVLATVYPTATNTFPWAIAGRRKLSMCERILTNDINRSGSILELAWKANRDLLRMENIPLTLDSSSRTGMLADFGWRSNGDLNGWHVSENTLSYSVAPTDITSILPRALRVQLPEYLGYSATMYGGNSYEVVKCAREAIANLVSDFRKLRLKYSSNARTGSSYIPTNTTGSFTWNTGMFGSEASISESSPVAELWKLRMRNVPRYIYAGGSDTSIGNDRYSDSSLYPFANAATARSLYTTVNARYVSEYGSNGDTDDVQCDIASAPVTESTFCDRSVVGGLLARVEKLADKPYYTDILRVAEAQSVSMDDKLMHPYRYRYGSTAKNAIGELCDAYTKILSIDGIPRMSDTIKLGDILPLLGSAQLAYVGGDAFAAYRAECTANSLDNDFDFVSDTLPSSTDLAEFLRNYTPMYASRMPTRMWNANRVYVNKSGFSVKPDNQAYRQVYYSRVKWLGAELDKCATAKAKYANDLFIRGSTSPYVVDSNLSWNFVDSNANGDVYLESNYSVPPGTVARQIYSTDGFTDGHTSGHGETYIRVFMKFIFSAKAGRWYCMEYRQAPVSYLTPLYGADALQAQLPSIYHRNGKPADVTITLPEVSTDPITATSDSIESVWKESMCGGYTWKDATMHPYYAYLPMNISAGVVPFMFKSFPYTPDTREHTESTGKLVESGEFAIGVKNDRKTANYLKLLDRPELPIERGGIGLYPPADCNGGYKASAVSGALANFWSVRKHLRPAVSVLSGTDIPGTYIDDDEQRVVTRTGGSMSDPTLWGQFQYPRKGRIDYILPDPEYPLEDMSDHALIYVESGDQGKLQIGSDEHSVYSYKK